MSPATAAKTAPASEPAHAPPRAIVDAVLPSIDGGRFAIKRVAGEPLTVVAHCFCDGHDRLRVVLCWRAEGDRRPIEVEMVARGNDEWVATIVPPAPGRYVYSVRAWVDAFLTWREELALRVDPADVRLAALTGVQLAEEAAHRAKGADRKALNAHASRLRKAVGRDDDTETLRAIALDPLAIAVAARYPDLRFAAASAVELPLQVDRERAAFGSWYELFPRSTASEPGRHGTFADVEQRLPRIAAMGFDVLYLPPIHPIGRVNRKGPNNTLVAGPDDVGSPWAIGAAEGGHTAILPELGTAEDFRRLVAAAATHGLEIALDIALQCAPDHPYVSERPQWFRHRPDGSVQFAENPPKKYQDIYPFDFETDDWRALWKELKGIFEHWVGEGVRIFRVDNPHTKAFAFWEWLIADIRATHPDVIFLAEAFTRPKVMHRLAKLGFSQSYTYFTWRHTAEELTEYFEELAQGPGVDWFRPNVWPNTPDILNEQFHGAGRPMFALRLLLAATLSPCYGIYGPAYELLENRPRQPGSEEYLDSEKYQLRRWNLDAPGTLADLVTVLNRVRRDNPALQRLAGLRFLTTDNPMLLAYARCTPEGDNALVAVVNLDPRYRQSGWIEMDDAALPVDLDAPYRMDDLLGGGNYGWQGRRGFVILDPEVAPGHVFLVRGKRVVELEAAPDGATA